MSFYGCDRNGKEMRKKLDTSKFIRSDDFCRITTDKFMVDGRMKQGDIVWVAGSKAVPITEDDPYTQRLCMIVHKLERGNDDKFHIITKPLYIIDPAALEKVEDDKEYRDQMEIDFDAEVKL